MGQFTPYIGLYIPTAGESGYDDSFASGMINLDQHDHSGGPNKGVPISSSGLADFSVTYSKLASNVADITTGIGVNSTPGLQNQLQILGILRNLFTLGNTATTGFLTMNGSAIAARTFQDSSSITWSGGDGLSNPSATVNIAGISPVTVQNGGTGLTSLTEYALLAGGTTTTGNVQQVSGLGTSGQVLTSNGAGALPTWQTVTAQNVQIATATFTAAEFDNLSSVRKILIPAQGAGIVPVIYSVWGKLNFGGTDTFHSGSSVRLYWGSGSTEYGFVFTSGTFKDGSIGSPQIFYYYADNTQASSATGFAQSTVENRNVTVGVNSSDFTGGAGNTVVIWCSYSLMQI